ncbi:16S rRNA methyltransferase [Clostridium sp. DMHC 10]|uniref:16S rRNA (guanine(527)-N(7))-methyltransferase RsmG n=1 Tax=Clostridium sp. DMHC 10 TaxID=747377 RepID=UPI00069FE8A7|nr:16S rRNA (guanine(527)-N(7))-methyltransferase RsmG [Clostridium sp. DMHC 10]KOF57521.1 16S rRNA methyltransferase [Clostridium sp. DMHC 10]
MQYFDIIKMECENIGLEINEEKYNKFIKYKDLMKEWNEKVNLTAITDDKEIIIKHFVDSIKAFEFKGLDASIKIIDVGTGAGLPGIPIKIMNDKAEVVLLDSLQKRINFLNEIIDQLKLDGIKTIHGRAEDFGADLNYREKFDVAISRAVANMAVLAEFCMPFVKKNGYFIALKGPAVEEEISEAKKAISVLGGKIEDIIQVSFQDSDLKHNLVIIKKIKCTPKQYPRRAGTVNKKPIK